MMVDDVALCAALRRRACLNAIAASRAELREQRRERRLARRRLPWANRPEVQRVIWSVAGALTCLAWLWICARFADRLSVFF